MLTEVLGDIQREGTTTKHTHPAPCTFKGLKRFKLTHGSEEDSTKGDVISELPDEVLSSILSLLPMKDEVKTSILSTRWRFLWASRANLEFDIHTMLGTSIPERSIQSEAGLGLVNSEYIKRVDNFLQYYRAPKINTFKVYCCIDQRSACHLDRWIKFAIAMGVELLEINLSAQPDSSPSPFSSHRNRSWYKPYRFPCLLLPHDEKTSTLKHLHLKFSTLKCPPNFNGFNTLVTLGLHEVKLNGNCLESLFSSCLVLEILNIRECRLPTSLKAVGPCVNLKCLEVLDCLGVQEILISSSKLTSFKFCGLWVDISLYNIPRLKILFFHRLQRNSMPSILTQLPKDLPKLENLFLSLTKEVPAKIASYPSLKELELEVSTSTNLLTIISTINALPRLLKLNLKLVDHYRKRIRTSGRTHNCLKEIEIYGFQPCAHTRLVIYLLKNCVALERMILDTTSAYYSAAGDLRLGETHTIIAKELVSPWKLGGGKEKFYERVNREVPGRGELVTIRK